MGEVSSLGKPPGWSHRKAMRDYIRSIGAFDRELHKEVARQNAANKVTESVVQQIIHDPLPIIETKPMSTNRTGLASVVGSLLSDLESAKQESLAAGETLSSAITEAKEAASEVRKVARDIQREAAEAMSALGQITNGSPD
jgi:hypothetical protein